MLAPLPPNRKEPTMKSVDEYAAQYREIVQAAVPEEEVLAVGVLCRPNGLMSAVAPGGLFIRLAGKKKSGGLPMNVIVAVTATRVLFYDFRPRMMAIKLKGLARTLPRQGLRVTIGAGTMATRVTFTEADGSSFELDSNKSIGQYDRLNDQLLGTLGAAPAAA
jgi:hypothetical protein